MNFGKVIKLFLLDGTPNGRWICELSNWTGIAYPQYNAAQSS